MEERPFCAEVPFTLYFRTKSVKPGSVTGAQYQQHRLYTGMYGRWYLPRVHREAYREECIPTIVHPGRG